MAAVGRAISVPTDRACTARRVAYSVPMSVSPEDSALMLRYQDGDVTAFEILYRRHNDALYRYLLRLCLHRDTAEDLYQEVSTIVGSVSIIPACRRAE